MTSTSKFLYFAQVWGKTEHKSHVCMPYVAVNIQLKISYKLRRKKLNIEKFILLLAHLQSN